jgi:hypothetical protein
VEDVVTRSARGGGAEALSLSWQPARGGPQCKENDKPAAHLFDKYEEASI